MTGWVINYKPKRKLKYFAWGLLFVGGFLILTGLARAMPVAEDVAISEQQAPVSYSAIESTQISDGKPLAAPTLVVPSTPADAAIPTKPVISNSQADTSASPKYPAAAPLDDAISLTPGAFPSQTGIPVRLVIPAIGLDTPVQAATWWKVMYEGYVFDQWRAPKNAGGWQTDSAWLGEPGNTVINGHNNEFGEVFRYLDKLNVGDFIYAYSVNNEYVYIVRNKMILLEAGASSKVRMENATWIGKSTDERLTLVTCWPYESNTYRLIIVASPPYDENGN